MKWWLRKNVSVSYLLKAKALNLIQQDWFKLAAQKDSNPALVEEHLNAFYSRFSNLLLERIVNMADFNV